jgi:hypothetical protein
MKISQENNEQMMDYNVQIQIIDVFRHIFGRNLNPIRSTDGINNQEFIKMVFLRMRIIWKGMFLEFHWKSMMKKLVSRRSFKRANYSTLICWLAKD